MGEIETTSHRSKNLTIFTARGTLTANDFRESTVNYYAGEVTPLILWDLTHAEVSAITTDEIRDLALLAKQVSTRREGGKTAFVFGRPFDFGLGRMFESYTEIENMPFTFRPFLTTVEARAWLGI